MTLQTGHRLADAVTGSAAGTDREFLVTDASTLSREYCRVVPLQ
jgi:hypothetical protein